MPIGINDPAESREVADALAFIQLSPAVYQAVGADGFFAGRWIQHKIDSS